MALFSRILLSLGLLTTTTAHAVTEQEVVKTYATIAHATFEDSLITARALNQQVAALLESPSETSLNNAKKAWKQARVPYQQSEVFRFGNANVDDWEGQLNAWPLDEGLIDYVDTDSYEAELGNIGSNANLIANRSLQLGGETLDISELTPELLASLNELGGSEANVASGYHAIEFLLWGQDLNGTAAGAGNRPYTDYALGDACTNNHCQRRREYLQAATQLLVEDLENMVQQWAPNDTDNYRQQLLSIPVDAAMTRMLFGMGSLALGELAGERLKVSLEANSPEDEHDCFSDNTHYSHFYNALGIQNVYQGEYRRVNDQLIKGASLSDLVEAKDPALNSQVHISLRRAQLSLQALVDSAERSEQPQKFDQLIAEGNSEGEAMINRAIEALVLETEQLELAARALGIDNLSPDNADHDF
ncbi:MAG: peptidase [Cellvibrionaceae bacterium]|nr:peptidase [Cellvibrionaceae bacterium]